MPERTGISISEMGRRYDVSLRALRYYESQSLLHPPRCGSDRFYSPSDEIRLQLILKGKRLGFTLQEIGRLIGFAKNEQENEPDLITRLNSETIARQVKLLEERRDEIEAAIAELKTGLASAAVNRGVSVQAAL